MKLIARLGTFYSPGDEDAMFAWLKSLKCVGRVHGEMRNLHIELAHRPNAAELREFIGLFLRYRLDMTPLAALKTARNASWFDDPNAIWHKQVFGRKMTSHA
jgi:hypothetical protein